MDEKELMERDIIDSLFEMGLMGIEIPEQFGGAGCNFFHVYPSNRSVS